MPDDWFEAEQLHCAAQSGDTALLERLILGGRDPNAFDDGGNTPLHYAAEGEHFEAVRLLLSRGANVNAAMTSVLAIRQLRTWHKPARLKWLGFYSTRVPTRPCPEVCKLMRSIEPSNASEGMPRQFTN